MIRTISVSLAILLPLTFSSCDTLKQLSDSVLTNEDIARGLKQALEIGIGEGAEMLKPLAITIVSGLSFSMLVSLLLVPVMYELTHLKAWKVTAPRIPQHSGTD